MNRFRSLLLIAASIAMTCGAVLMPPRAEGQTPSMPEQAPPIVIGDVFQFIKGSWAEYDMLDRTQDKAFTLRFSILDGRNVRRFWTFWRSRPYQWMEIAVSMPDSPRVVIKCLAEITPDGPGVLHEAIVQIEEYENPIRLKRRWLRGHDEPIAKPDVEWIDHRADEHQMSHNGRTFTAWRVEATDDEGRALEAVVSLDLPPFGLFLADTPDIRMQIRDWGMGAESELTGNPLGLMRWVARQVRQTMAQEKAASNAP